MNILKGQHEQTRRRGRGAHRQQHLLQISFIAYDRSLRYPISLFIRVVLDISSFDISIRTQNDFSVEQRLTKI